MPHPAPLALLQVIVAALEVFYTVPEND